jgi:hypothetical protein
MVFAVPSQCINYTPQDLSSPKAPKSYLPPPHPPPNYNNSLMNYAFPLGFFSGIHIRLDLFRGNMRQKLITLDPTSWDLAAKKTNFSEWVRNQLRSERNKGEQHTPTPLREMSTDRIRHELHRRIEEMRPIRGEEE